MMTTEPECDHEHPSEIHHCDGCGDDYCAFCESHVGHATPTPDEAVVRLPTVPAAAVEVVMVEAGLDGVDALAVLDAAWPHLYAAALRHAADVVMRTPGPGDVAVVNGSYSRGRLAAVTELRRLAADTAAP